MTMFVPSFSCAWRTKSPDTGIENNSTKPNDEQSYILGLTISERDKARMHDLVVRNQNGALTPTEKKEMHDFGKAGDVLAILKSKARRTLGFKPKKRTIS
jgi:hypothetical protein